MATTPTPYATRPGFGSVTLVMRISDGATIPPDPANTDYAAYLSWVTTSNGGSPAPTMTAWLASGATLSPTVAALLGL